MPRSLSALDNTQSQFAHLASSTNLQILHYFVRQAERRSMERLEAGETAATMDVIYAYRLPPGRFHQRIRSLQS